MALNITKEAYTKLIEQDLKYLRKYLPDNPESDHIRLVLTNSIDMHYSSEGSEQPDTESGLHLADVSKMLPDEKDEKYQEDRNEICFRAFINMPPHLVRKNVENGFDLGVRYIKSLLGNFAN